MAKFKETALERKEEQTGKDLDGDGEKGEPIAHQKKVLGGAKLSPNQKVPTMADKMNKMGGSSPKLPTGVGKPMASQDAPTKPIANGKGKAAPFPAKATSKKSGAKGKGKQVPMIPSKMCPSCIKSKSSSCSH